MGKEGMDQSMPGVSRGGMDDHPRRLVDHQQIGILMEDFERDGFRFQKHRLGGRLRERNECAGSDGLTRFDRPAIHSDMALADERLHAGAREPRQLPGQESVQPIPRGARINRELWHLPE